MSQFAFLQADWPDVYDAAAKAESAAHADPRASCFYARRALELLVHRVYKHDSAVVLPYQDTEPSSPRSASRPTRSKPGHRSPRSTPATAAGGVTPLFRTS